MNAYAQPARTAEQDWLMQPVAGSEATAAIIPPPETAKTRAEGRLILLEAVAIVVGLNAVGWGAILAAAWAIFG